MPPISFLEIIKATAFIRRTSFCHVSTTKARTTPISMTGATHLAHNREHPGFVEKLAEDTNTDDEKVIQLNVQKYKGANIHAIEPKTAESVEMLGTVQRTSPLPRMSWSRVWESTALKPSKRFSMTAVTVVKGRVANLRSTQSCSAGLMFEKNDEVLRNEPAALIESEGDVVLMEGIPEDNGRQRSIPNLAWISSSWPTTTIADL